MAKVLVADDEDNYRLLLKAVLEKAGYDVVVATNGTEAMAVLETGRPDIAVLDVNMPGFSGFELCEKIRAHPQQKKMPVLLLTVAAEPEKQVEGYDKGADDYLPKPFSVDVLVARLKTLERRILKS